MVIHLTESASARIKEMMEEEDRDVFFRFGVKGGGCSGLSYSLGFDEEIDDQLDLQEEVNGILVVVRKEDIPIIEGTTIDYKENLMGGGFTIDNPKAIYSCGCGSSFRTAEVAGTPGDC